MINELMNLNDQIIFPFPGATGGVKVKVIANKRLLNNFYWEVVLEWGKGHFHILKWPFHHSWFGHPWTVMLVFRGVHLLMGSAVLLVSTVWPWGVLTSGVFKVKPFVSISKKNYRLQSFGRKVFNWQGLLRKVRALFLTFPHEKNTF